MTDPMALVEIWRAWGEAEARIVQGLLESAGIPTALRGESIRLTHGFTMDGLGEVRILVRPEDDGRARAVLADAGSMTVCADCDSVVRVDDPFCRFCKAVVND